MKRVGAKNAPVFRIVVADGRSPRDGKFIEEIGTYQPLKKGDNFKLDLDRAKYWLGKGAQPSDTVASFIKKATKAAATTPEPAIIWTKQVHLRCSWATPFRVQSSPSSWGT